MKRLCIRGGGRIGKKVLQEVKQLHVQDSEILYIADKDEKKQGKFIEETVVITVERSVELYGFKQIDGFVIPFAYGQNTIMAYVKELINNSVCIEDIMIYSDGQFICLSSYEIDLALMFNHYDLLSDKTKKELMEKLRITDCCRKPVIIVCGENWLARYVMAKNPDALSYQKNQLLALTEDTFYIVCEFDYLKYLINVDAKQKIYLYDWISAFFYSNSLWFQTYHVQTGKTHAEGLVTGISTIRDAIEEAEIMNLANVTQDLFYDFQLLKRYGLELKQNLKYVIMGLGPLSFCFDMSMSEKSQATALLYLPIVEKPHHLKNADFYQFFFENERQKIDRVLARFDVAECFYNFYLSGKLNLLNPYDRQFDELSLSEREKLRIQEETIYNFYKARNQNTTAENKKIMIEYFEFCKNYLGTKICIFYPPYTNFYKHHIDYELFDEVKSFVASNKNKYDLQILDLSELSISDDYFYDYLHLNTRGRALVNQYVDTFLRGLK